MNNLDSAKSDRHACDEAHKQVRLCDEARRFLHARKIHEEGQTVGWQSTDQKGKNTCSQYSISAGCTNVDDPGCHWKPFQCPAGWILGGDDVQGNVVTDYNDCCVRGTCQDYETSFHPCHHNPDHMCMSMHNFNCTEHIDPISQLPMTDNHEWDPVMQMGNFQKQPPLQNPEATCCKVPTCGEYSKEPETGHMQSFNCTAYGREENHNGFKGWWHASPGMDFPPSVATNYVDVCCGPIVTFTESSGNQLLSSTGGKQSK